MHFFSHPLTRILQKHQLKCEKNKQFNTILSFFNKKSFHRFILNLNFSTLFLSRFFPFNALRKTDDFWIFVLVLKTFVGFEYNPPHKLIVLFILSVCSNECTRNAVRMFNYLHATWVTRAFWTAWKKWLSTFSRHLNSSWPERKTFLREAF